ncbi:hypothetical protein CspeluHIS016_0304210 [Cutaneotrichosporon spelunceum]|uniref:Choline/carnitine acyltransferase domain-containing protein n=1 Tax=Cutaneotrichosporon spelunceum TaxID=1672016 RepID=A0AAD3TU67_9TREE|nr:hypothetical protein CspeluHIS016_0304210 [Cutaneotrichosporon spelunceum]
MPISPFRPQLVKSSTIARLAANTSASRTLPLVHTRMFSHTGPKSKDPTFANQDKLPRLPIPKLEDAVEVYFKSIQPLLEQKYSAAELPKEIEKRRLIVNDFAAKGSIGHALHERLTDLDEISPNNWLDDTLWLALAYHTWRAPMLVNSNWFLTFQPDPKDAPPPTVDGATNNTPLPLNALPLSAVPAGSQGGGEEWIKSHPDKSVYYQPVAYEEVTKQEWNTPWQLRRASWLISRFAQYRAMVDRQQIGPDVTKAGPLDMNQYKLLFNISRIPLPGTDAFSRQDNKARHVTVLINDFIYSVDVFGQPGEDGVADSLPPAEIERLLQEVSEDARKRAEGGEEASMVGVLTADHRDTWAVNRERIMLTDPKNRETFDWINRSLVALTLDRYTIPTLPTEDPLRMAPIDAQIRNAFTGINGGRNRWYDKCLTIVVENSGRAAVMGEHSPIDALIPSFVIDYALEEAVDESKYTEPLNDSSNGWLRNDFVIDEEMKEEIVACAGRNQMLISDSDVSTLWWAEYGTEWIKKQAKMAPDAFIQQVLQLAWYRDQGYASATYETASTRAFKHGRTDVIRSLTPESREFVKAMQDPTVPDEAKHTLLQKATVAHNTFTKESSNGKGIDRYLMGLKVQLRPGETHALFEDEMYSKSQEWKLSTSGLSSGIRFMATGFGSAWPDGYGLNYMAGPFLIKFGIESKVSCDVTSTARFKHRIAQAFRDLRELCEKVGGAKKEGDKANL